jgi:hypothetical protein
VTAADAEGGVAGTTFSPTNTDVAPTPHPNTFGRLWRGVCADLTQTGHFLHVLGQPVWV